ncbi:hypothetical protein PL11201_80488 [Planktothrix sp. PCC 11201]|nr:hypothetical protein PL11201_80488 [Planktothrix sp. PCC 11201]
MRKYCGNNLWVIPYITFYLSDLTGLTFCDSGILSFKGISKN